MSGKNTAGYAPIADGLRALRDDGETVEIRSFGSGKYATHKYFDDLDEAAEHAVREDAHGKNVYQTFNELSADLMYRDGSEATKDREVTRRRWLLVDVDPERVTGVSASDAERKKALEVARKIRDRLREEGWPDPFVFDSGNGFHLLYRIDLPNDPESEGLVKGALEGLAFRFNTEEVAVDTKVSNASRITRVYGTKNRKGRDGEERPHRHSGMLAEAGDGVVTAAQLREISPPEPDEPKTNGRGRRRIKTTEAFDVQAWLEEHGVPVKKSGPYQGGHRWILEECPEQGHADDSAYIIQFPSGGISAGCSHNSCRGGRGDNAWHDWRAHFEPGWEPYETDDSANSANCAKGVSDEQEEPDPWAPPAAFHSVSLPQFPRGVFPEWVEAQVDGTAEATQTPRDLSGMLALGAGAAASAKVVDVEVWAGWREPTNLYTATAMRSGSRKTTVFQRMTAPIEQHEARLVEETAEEIAEQRTRYKVYEERLKKAQTKAAKAEGDELDALTADAMTAASDLESIRVPATPRLLVDDASPERVASMLAEQGGRLALMSPEGGVFDMMAGRYHGGIPNLDVYLKGHAGDALRVDRVGRPADHVRKPALTIALAVQPDVLRGFADRPGFRGRGLVGRHLYSIPNDTLGRRAIRPRAVPERVGRRYAEKLRALLELADNLPVEEREAEVLRFGPEAQDEMEAFLGWLEPMLAEGGDLGDMTDWAGKLAGAVARIAGILHMLERAGESEPWGHRVAGETMRRAVRIGRYLVPHAKYALAVMGSDPTVDDAKYILRWIKRKGGERFTKRDTFEGTKGRFRKVAELEPGLDLLVSHGYLREHHPQGRRGAGRKPSPAYEVNPVWLAELDRIKNERPSQNSHYSQNGVGDTADGPGAEDVGSDGAPEDENVEMTL